MASGIHYNHSVERLCRMKSANNIVTIKIMVHVSDNRQQTLYGYIYSNMEYNCNYLRWMHRYSLHYSYVITKQKNVYYAATIKVDKKSNKDCICELRYASSYLRPLGNKTWLVIDCCLLMISVDAILKSRKINYSKS